MIRITIIRVEMNYTMNRFIYIGLVFLVAIVATGSLFAGGSSEQMEEDGPDMMMKGPIVVASKVDTEGGLLGHMIVALLVENGFEVEDRVQFGTTDVIRTAIMNGEIDIYPEYTGNGQFFYPQAADDSVWKNPSSGYETVKRLDKESHDLEWLTPAPANNTWAIAIRQDLAQAEGLRTLQDMGEYISRGGTFKLAASEEFVTRPDALPSFQATYNFELSNDQLLTFSGGNTALTEKAAGDQTDGVNAAMAYGTDGQLAAFGLTVMVDNLEVQPVYEPAPLVRGAVLEQYPEIAEIFEPVFLSLDLAKLQALNSSIAVDGLQSSEVARNYLIENGFIES